jgi:hypothetical protein
MSDPPDSSRTSSPLNELVRRLALLAAPRTYSLTARLLGGKDGSRVELRAAVAGSGVDAREYSRHITLQALETRGASVIAKEFAQEAAEALAETPEVAKPRRNRESANKTGP